MMMKDERKERRIDFGKQMLQENRSLLEMFRRQFVVVVAVVVVVWAHCCCGERESRVMMMVFVVLMESEQQQGNNCFLRRRRRRFESSKPANRRGAHQATGLNNNDWNGRLLGGAAEGWTAE